MFYFGVILFSASVGFFFGASGSSALSKELAAIAGAVVAVLTLVEKVNQRGLSHTEQVTASTKMGDALGGTLLAMTAGFGLGLAGGLCLHLRHPLIFTDRLPVIVPWTEPGKAPAELKDATAWLAISERLRSAGLTPDEIRALYAKYPDAKENAAFLDDHGSRWIGTRPGAPSGLTAAGTK